VASNYCAGPGLAFYKGFYPQGDKGVAMLLTVFPIAESYYVYPRAKKYIAYNRDWIRSLFSETGFSGPYKASAEATVKQCLIQS
jgi:hypothetical protein